MFFTQFGLLFANMQWYVIVMLIAAIILLIFEAAQPGFGVFGITGGVLLILSIIFRAVFHKENDNVLMQVFQFIIFDIIIFGLLILCVFIAWKAGWLKKTPFFLSGTAVDEKHSAGTEDYSYLLDKEGVAATMLRPSGKARIDDKLYDVESTGFYIQKGTAIKVSKIEDGIIRVIEIKDQKTKDKE